MFSCSTQKQRKSESAGQKKKGYWNWPGKLQSVHLYIILATFIIQLHTILYWHLVALRWAYICFSLSLFFFYIVHPYTHCRPTIAWQASDIQNCFMPRVLCLQQKVCPLERFSLTATRRKSSIKKIHLDELYISLKSARTYFLSSFVYCREEKKQL